MGGPRTEEGGGEYDNVRAYECPDCKPHRNHFLAKNRFPLRIFEIHY